MAKKGLGVLKFMISVDCEGCAGVVGEPGCSLSNSYNMRFAAQQATRETNAAVRALFDSGATQVVVWDSHGEGANLECDQLDKRCEIILGSGFSRRFPELDETYAGVLMIGYHAMAGTANAILAHTYSSSSYHSIRVNGIEVGEIPLDAAVAGALEIPLLFVSSDDKGCAEALRFIPQIETVETKQGMGRNCAFSKHPATVEKQIYKAVCTAVKQLDSLHPFTFPQPTTIEIEYETLIQLLKARIRRSGWCLTKKKTLKKTLVSMLEWQC